MPRGVIWDMDGVLVASGSAHAASWRIVARKDGVELTDATFKQTFGRTSRDIIKLVWGDDTSEDEIKRIDAAKEAAYRDLIHGMVPLTIGVRETLATLQAAGLRMAVATSGPRENVDLVLGETRLDSYFEALVTGFDVQRGKPAPDCFLLAAERLEVPPMFCVVVEDAPAGIEAAVAAGMPAIGFTSGHGRAALLERGAAATVDRLSDITSDLIASLLPIADA